jgi:hypothetical protein
MTQASSSGTTYLRIRGGMRMERNGAFWHISRCMPQVLRASLQAGPASAGAIGDTSKTCLKVLWNTWRRTSFRM